MCYTHSAVGRREYTQEVIFLKKYVIVLITALMLCFAPTQAYASDTVHTVVKGDTMWKIAVKYQVGTSEIVKANPQIPDPNLIYPGQKLNIPGKDGTVTAYEAEVVRLVNSYRAQYGLSPLSENWELSRVARFKSQDMCDRKYFSHTSPTYGSPFDMIKAFGLGYRTAGENIARGQTSPQEVVHAWMNSSGHRANILNSSFRYIGVGYVASGNYWTQMFTG